VNIEDIEFQMDPDSNFKTETNHILEDGNFYINTKIYNYHIFVWI